MNQESRKKIVRIIIVFICVAGTGTGLGFYFWYNPIFFEERTPQKFFWVRWSDNAASVLDTHYDMIDMVSPNWFVLGSDGNVSYGGDWGSSTPAEHNELLTT
ncbi:MAG: hypothetical protein GF364_18065, partial [Candidatus Lokiarchaeota archaeon]|nr:hypothetical protein [Candidatus Lokiarchaeota archaeon]